MNSDQTPAAKAKAGGKASRVRRNPRMVTKTDPKPGKPPGGPVRIEAGTNALDVERRAPRSRSVPLPPIPPILLEGDEPSFVSEAGPGRKYALGNVTSETPATVERDEPAPSYGTGIVWLVAREPRSLYATWDLSQKPEEASLLVRVYQEGEPQRPVAESPVSGKQHCFISVERAGTQYQAEVGYYGQDRKWVGLGVSQPAATPPEAPSDDKTVQFVTLEELPVQERAREPQPERPEAEPQRQMLQAPQPLLQRTGAEPRWGTTIPPIGGQTIHGRPAISPSAPSTPVLQDEPVVAHARSTVVGLSRIARARARRSWKLSPALTWSKEQEQALAELVRPPQPFRESMDSKAVIESMGGGPRAEAPPPALVQMELPGLPLNIWSAAGGGAEHPEGQGFWLNVNAELVVYGATEPDAHVAVGGRPIQLRPDGTFSCRFALPDGSYGLTVMALSKANEARAVDLWFSRGTITTGEVGASKPEPGLKPPATEGVS